MTLPTLTVQLDDGSGTFPYDISARVQQRDGYGITRGREDWQGAVTAGQLTLTLNNSDGFFTNGNGFGAGGFGAGGFGGPVAVVDLSVRLKETVNGVTSTRFTGNVKSWPVSWPATVVTFSTIPATVTDLQAALERRTMKSMLEEEILFRGPTAYYTLGEAEGSTSAGDTSGNQAPPLTSTGTGTPVTFGQSTGPTDGLTTATFAGGKWLTNSLSPGLSYSELVAFSSATAPAVQEGLHATGSELLVLETSGKVALYSGIGIVAIATSAASVCDGGVHQVGWSVNSTVGYQLFVDGVTTTVANASAGTTAAVVPGFQVGGLVPGLVALGDSPLTGNVSHVAHFDGMVLTAFEVAGLFNVFSGASESVHNRMQRLCGYVGVVFTAAGLKGDPFGLGPDPQIVTAQSTSGQSIWDAMQAVTAAEGGVLYADLAGSLGMQGRDFQAKTIPDLTLGSQWVTPDVQPVLDDQQIVNYFETTAEGTGATQVVRDAASEDSHGRYPESQSYLVPTDSEALDRANWYVAKLAEPTPRYGTLTINLYGMPATLASTVLDALEVGCWLRVTSLASQNPGGTTADVIVQGWNEQVNAETWSITCNVVSRSLYSALIVDDPVYGVIDTYPVMF